MNHIELERLVCAGAVDAEFRQLILRDPLRAAEGYQAERFHLTSEEKALLVSIHANDFQVFVETVTDWIAHERNGFAFPEPSPRRAQIVPSERRTSSEIFSMVLVQT